MNRYVKVGLYGLLTWLMAFGASLLIFPLRAAQRPLFESIMAVIVTLGAVLFAGLYFRGLTTGFLKTGVLIGTAWLIINLAIDLPLFMLESPMQMSFSDYLMDIGITYLIIPIVSTGFGFLLQQRANR